MGTPPTSQAFAGEYEDTVIGAYSLGNGYRCYLPSLMRFAARDSLSPFASGGVNPYVYCGDDPINQIDPTGHMRLPKFTLNLGEDFEERMRGSRSSGHAVEHQAAPSIAAANATDWSAVHNQALLSPAEWDARNNAATGIQRHWRGFATRRKIIPEATRHMAASMGESLTHADEFFKRMREGRILVQANGEPGNPVIGHSVIYSGYLRHELLHMAAPPMGSKYAISNGMAEYVNMVNNADAVKAGAHSFIRKDFATSTPADMEDLVTRGRMFALDPKYLASFDTAYDAEVQSFHQAPYSYGIHYNCNTFVYNVLRRLRRLAG